MKLHDNSRFGRRFVVLASNANLLKSHRLIEDSGSLVGFSHLQKDLILRQIQQRFEQFPGDTQTPELRRYRQVQDLALALSQTAPDQKAGNHRSEERRV